MLEMGHQTIGSLQRSMSEQTQLLVTIQQMFIVGRLLSVQLNQQEIL